MGQAIFGIFMGMGLLTAKYCSYWMLTGGPVQIKLPRYLIFGRFQPVRDRIHESTFLLFCVDAIGGWAGMHVLAAFGATNLALIAMVAYSMACMSILMFPYVKQGIKNYFNLHFNPAHWVDQKKKKKKKYSWQEV